MMLLAGCTVGPSQRPSLATYGTGQTEVVGTAPSSVPVGPGGPGQVADPIRWEACPDVDRVDRTTGLSFDVDCASVVVDRSSPNSFGDPAVEVARARADGVPEDAPPWWSSAVRRVRTVAVRSQRWPPACRLPSGSTSR